ncbi:hypothetical protein HJC23_002331 [Cyclotella cryptica]|uniref:ADP-ribosylglycohydrolase n=1 Tax=Cyclotella cryptica TaxID=29204 RepID=A0ABD3QKN5_9STRA|eukprot:CCRYP_004417-RA/>CCRYP_004417-RA protein AED:0.07 eAED:0.07 QI:98/1/1/1/0.5/0.33/3/1696/424
MLHAISFLIVFIATNLSHHFSDAMIPPQPVIESRIRGALWGLFSGDALASPTHWYYGGFPQIQSDYGRDGIMGYTKPKLHLPGSILNKSDPNGGGRLRPLSGRGKNLSIIGDVINHGKLKYWDPKQSFHYHATLQAGENTLKAQLARVLMKSIVANKGCFNEDHFRQAYIDFMTTEGSHNDTYASTCHRMFFANMIFNKRNPKDCPDNDGHNVDAIDGLVLPTVTALAETARQYVLSGGNGIDDDAQNAIELAAARTAAVTRSSDLLERVSGVWANLVKSAIMTPASNAADSGNEMEKPLVEVARQLGLRNPQPTGRDQMTACYLAQSLPPTLDMISKYTQQSSGTTCWKALLANANVGGENVHRGAVLGAILGARAGDEQLPAEMKDGLFEREDIEREIDLFVESVMTKTSDGAREQIVKEEL